MRRQLSSTASDRLVEGIEDMQHMFCAATFLTGSVGAAVHCASHASVAAAEHQCRRIPVYKANRILTLHSIDPLYMQL